MGSITCSLKTDPTLSAPSLPKNEKQGKGGRAELPPGVQGRAVRKRKRLTLTFSSEDKDPVTCEDLEFVVLGGRHHLNDRERNQPLRIWLLQQSKWAGYEDPPIIDSSAQPFRELIFDITRRILDPN